MTITQRNFLILGLIAVAGLVATDSFNVGAGELEAVLSLLFTVLMLAFGVVIYYRHSGTIAQMPAKPRLVMQASCGLLFFLVAVGTLPQVLPLVHVPLPPPVGFSGLGGTWTLLFWAGILGGGFGAWWAWQQRTSRW